MVRKTGKQVKPITTKAGEVRGLTKAEVKKMRPAKEVFPDLVKGMAELKAASKRGDLIEEKLPNGDVQLRVRGRPRSAAPRGILSVRIDPKLEAIIKAAGKGYSAKVEAALWKAAHDGAFGRSGGSRK